ncbi:hypothetical protein EHJ15_16750 [Cronobacter muytjensii]|nr:hypothetical protein [Cronobacter muytjensii]
MAVFFYSAFSHPIYYCNKRQETPPARQFPAYRSTVARHPAS